VKRGTFGTSRTGRYRENPCTASFGPSMFPFPKVCSWCVCVRVSARARGWVGGCGSVPHPPVDDDCFAIKPYARRDGRTSSSCICPVFGCVCVCVCKCVLCVCVCCVCVCVYRSRFANSAMIRSKRESVVYWYSIHVRISFHTPDTRNTQSTRATPKVGTKSKAGM